MKKITLLLCCTISFACFSQTLPNAGFETWVNTNILGQTYNLPQHWISSDLVQKEFDSLYTAVSVTKSTVPYAGSFAVKMETAINHSDTVAGTIISVESISDYFNGVFGGKAVGFPYSTRSANLQGYYKFSSTGNDIAAVAVCMTKWNTTTHVRDTIVPFAATHLTIAATYTMFNMPLTYTLSEIPDTVLIEAGISGINGAQSHVGTVFYLDALSFSGTAPLGIDEINSDNKFVKLYPNPFSSNAVINIDPAIKLNNASISIYDILGKNVKTINIDKNEVTLEKGDMSAGLYFYKLLNNNAEAANGKFIIK